MDRTTSSQADDINLLDAAIRINTAMLSIVFGLAGGAVLWFSTYILLIQGGESVGTHLSLLSIFLPGYEVSYSGAWIGFLWGFFLGALMGWFVYWTYARGLRRNLLNFALSGQESDRFSNTTLIFSGRSLGVGIGILLAIQLFATTTWLVLRGTADQSEHAALLINYLPGYEISFYGGLIGALEVFVLAYIICQIFSTIYNFVAKRRAGL